MREVIQLTFDPAAYCITDNIHYPCSLPQLDFQLLFFTSEFNSFTAQSNNISLAILGDSLTTLRQMKDNSVNLIFADAPYNIGKDFGNNQDKWDSISSYIKWC